MICILVVLQNDAYHNTSSHFYDNCTRYDQITFTPLNLSGKFLNVLEFYTGFQSGHAKIKSTWSSSGSPQAQEDKEQWIRSSGCQIEAIVENKFKTTPGVQGRW